MQIYLVGGAVRDQLLQRQTFEHDYVVVGATPEQMLALGYQAVGKDFPVFLHPQSKEEYALARTERKKGHGYTGFECFSSPDVTLEQDLIRRDLTVNAMAMADDGTIIDPYGGQRDLNDRVLRHVSQAFCEDPLRVLRVARFAARYYDYGFTIAPETLDLMRQISQSGELQHLTPERIWKETVRALAEDHVDIYFYTLKKCGALAVLFPEIEALFGVPQRPQYHPEVDCGIHTMMALQQACRFKFDPIVRFAVLCHDFGKALTPPDMLPRHLMHEERGIEPVRQFCNRLRVPNEYKEVALKVCEFHLLGHKLFSLKAKTVWKVLKQLYALKKPQWIVWFSQACMCDARGRLTFENRPYPQLEGWQQAAELVRNHPLHIPEGLRGAEIGEYVQQQYIQVLKRFLQHQQAVDPLAK